MTAFNSSNPATFIPTSRCLRCRNTLNATTAITGTVPKEGDISICGYCGNAMVFTETNNLRAADQGELDLLKHEDSEVWRIMEFSRRYFEARRARREN